MQNKIIICHVFVKFYPPKRKRTKKLKHESTKARRTSPKKYDFEGGVERDAEDRDDEKVGP